jgi:hypothetical protein
MNEATSNNTTDASQGTGASLVVPLDLPASATGPAKVRGRADLQTWTGLVTLFALAIYGAARFGDTAFYARLGTDPDTVGLNYAITLSRVATTIAVASASVIALFLFGTLNARPKEDRGHQGPVSKTFYFAALVIAIILSTLLLVLIIPPELISIVRIRGIVALVCSFGLLRAGYMWKKADLKVHSVNQTRSVIAIAMSVVVLFGAAALTGYHSAGYIMKDELLPCPCVSFLGHNITLPWSSGTNGFLGIKAERAEIQWIGPGRRAVPSAAIFLGGSNSSVVLYDTSSGTVLIVPSSDVIVIPYSNLTGWNET